MMLNKYGSYKDSGVKWLGDIPSNWNVERLKYLTDKVGDGIHTTPFYVNESDFYFINGNNLKNNKIMIFGNTACVSKEEYLKYKVDLKKNTILMSINGTIGSLAFYDYENVILGKSAAYINFKLNKPLKYYYYLLGSATIQNGLLKNIAYSFIKNLSLEGIRNAFLLSLETSEAITISNFLDKKTSQIDEKIILLQEKKESFEELKKSLINETVCRGIDKNVELKDSGIEWIGKIPQHWRVERGKDRFFYGKRINKGLICKNVLSLTYGGVINKDFDTIAGLNPGSYETYQFVNKDDLIFKLIDLENIKTSRVGIVHEHGIMSSAYIRLNPKRSTFSRYYYYLYFFYYKINLFNYLGGGVRSTLNYSNLLEIPIIRSQSKEEQIQIANYLDEKTSKIDKIVSKINNQIETLKEFRKTLINDIVTGKVRVQDE